MESSIGIWKYDLMKNSINFQRYEEGDFGTVGFLCSSAVSRELAMAAPIGGGLGSASIETPKPWIAGRQ